MRILRMDDTADTAVVTDLKAAFDDAIAGGARDVVVELSDEHPVPDELVPLLRNLASTMLARDATLWLAAPWCDGRGHTLRPLGQAGSDCMRGVSGALDAALDRAAEGRAADA